MRFFGRKLDACKNRPTQYRRGFLHEITQFQIEAGSHLADNSNEAWYRLLLNELERAAACGQEACDCVED